MVFAVIYGIRDGKRCDNGIYRMGYAVMGFHAFEIVFIFGLGNLVIYCSRRSTDIVNQLIVIVWILYCWL